MPPLKQQKRYWVYMLLCENQHYYTGYTNNLLKRYSQHVKGTGGCKYTRSFKPIALVQCWQIKGGKALAMQIERYIKSLSRNQKTRLIQQPTTLSQDARIKPLL